MNSGHDDVSYILDQMSTLRLSLDQFLVLCASKEDEVMSDVSEEDDNKINNYDYKEVIDEAMSSISRSDEYDMSDAGL